MLFNAILAGLIAVWALPGRAASESKTTEPTACWVSILPQKYFVERIGGGHVVTRVMVGAGQSPATYEPTARQLAQLAEADVYFHNPPRS